MFQRARGKRRTGYAYADAAPRTQQLPPEGPPDSVQEARRLRALARLSASPHVEPTKQPGTIKAQLLGKLGPRGYQRLVSELREVAAE